LLGPERGARACAAKQPRLRHDLAGLKGSRCIPRNKAAGGGYKHMISFEDFVPAVDAALRDRGLELELAGGANQADQDVS
jgi:hypothetical protein